VDWVWIVAGYWVIATFYHIRVCYKTGVITKANDTPKHRVDVFWASALYGWIWFPLWFSQDTYVWVKRKLGLERVG